MELFIGIIGSIRREDCRQKGRFGAMSVLSDSLLVGRNGLSNKRSPLCFQCPYLVTWLARAARSKVSDQRFAVSHVSAECFNLKARSRTPTPVYFTGIRSDTTTLLPTSPPKRNGPSIPKSLRFTVTSPENTLSSKKNGMETALLLP